MPRYRIDIDPEWKKAWHRDQNSRPEGESPKEFPFTSGLPHVLRACDPVHAVRLARLDGNITHNGVGLIATEIEDEQPDSGETGEKSEDSA